MNGEERKNRCGVWGLGSGKSGKNITPPVARGEAFMAFSLWYNLFIESNT